MTTRTTELCGSSLARRARAAAFALVAALSVVTGGLPAALATSDPVAQDGGADESTVTEDSPLGGTLPSAIRVPEPLAESADAAGPAADPEPARSAGVPAAAAGPARPPVDAFAIADDWRRRIDELALAMAGGKQNARDADRLFWELNDALWPYLHAVHAAIDERAPDLVDRQASLDLLYAQRIRLFSLISPHLREQLELFGPVGREALANEFAYLQTIVLGQLRSIQRGLKQVTENVIASPVTTAWGMLQVIFALAVFRGWRRWSQKGLPAVRSHLLHEVSPPRTNLVLARVVWYLHRINRPLSWLVLVFVLSRLVMPRGFEGLADLVYTILIWLLAARVAILLIDAMALRGAGGLRGENRDLRLRTLRLAAAWAVALGLGLGLVDRYVGQGSIHAWGVRAAEIVTTPLVLLVVYWWRDEIFVRLAHLSEYSRTARSLCETRKGIWSYPAAVIGAGYLIWESVLRRLVHRLSLFEGGRRALAVLVRTRSDEGASRSGVRDEGPISEALRDALLEERGVLLTSVATRELASLAQSLQTRKGGASVVLAERGGGKTTFLRRLTAESGDEMKIVECPVGGYAALEAALASAFDIDAAESAEERLIDAIESTGTRVIAIDDAQHLARPFMGGQRALDRLAALDGRLHERLNWVLVLDRCAWRYVLLSRGDRALLQEVVELPPWSEEQLTELVHARCGAAGVDPDYTRFVLPRQLDTGELETLEDRNRYGYGRMLWESSDGNPGIAMRLFVDSLRATDDGRTVVHLPSARFSAALNDASVETWLILRVILQCDIASVDDVAKSLRISPARAAAGVDFALQNQWLEAVEGGVRLRWEWYPTVTRLLERKNFMPR